MLQNVFWRILQQLYIVYAYVDVVLALRLRVQDPVDHAILAYIPLYRIDLLHLVSNKWVKNDMN